MMTKNSDKKREQMIIFCMDDMVPKNHRPENHILSYYTTNRNGYREYRNCPETCASCPSLHRCTESKKHIKVVTRHVWEEYMEKAEDIQHTLGNKQIYGLRKETIEKIFGTVKE